MNVSLANKYRPKILNDLHGQSAIVKFLMHLINNNLNKNIIFKGEYGTGKTTSARIYARSMLCTNKVNNLDACGECPSCKSFDLNQSKDCLEFDAASKGSIENIRSLLDAFNTPPIFSNKKIWIIDEAHSMSPKAWDVLLKTIEEPKDFQIVLFCTNYPEKIRPAILSRCIILELKRLSLIDSVKLLKKIISKENIIIDDNAIELIAYYSKGHSRDLLKNLEHATYAKEINVLSLKELYIGSTYDNAYKILNALCSENCIIELDTLFKDVIDYTKDYESFLELVLYLKCISLHNYRMTSLLIDKVFQYNDLIVILDNIKRYCSIILIDVNKFYTRIDDMVLASKVSSIIDFKFFLHAIYDKLHDEVNNIDQSVTPKSNQKRRVNDKNETKQKINKTIIDLNIESNTVIPAIKIKEEKNEIPEAIEIYAHQLINYGFNNSCTKENLIYV